MPRNTGNFQIRGSVDGKKARIKAAPYGKEGGFDLTIYIRDAGNIRKAVTIEGRAYDGKVHLEIKDADKHSVLELVTER